MSDEKEESFNPATDVAGLIKVSTPFNSKDYIGKIKELILGGHVDPLAVYTVLKRMNKISETIFEDKQIKQIVLDEADKHLSGNTKSFDLYSAKICKMPTYTWYDFNGCGHPVLEELYKIQKEVAARIKQIEDELKLLIVKETTQIGLGILDDSKAIVVEAVPELAWINSGETLRVQAPKKLQTIGLKFMKI